jgi:flagellar M-ring protein FliF
MKDVVPPVPITDRIQAFISEYGLLILMLLLIITLILSLLQRKEVEEEVEDLQLQIAEGIIEPEKPVYRDIDVDGKSEIREQLERLIKQKPDAVAALLRNWLSDDWD